MFFNAKKLISQKQLLEEKIQTEHRKMGIAYRCLKEELREFYSSYQCFDMFDITVVDFWFGEIACCYDGENYDLSNVLFAMNNQLENVEAETITGTQLINIYNVFTFLFNDMYAGEEPILSQSSLPMQSILEKFEDLSNNFIRHLKSQQSTYALNMCGAIEKLYTLLDFSLRDTSTHRYLRHLKDQYIRIQTKGYDNIDRYTSQIREIDAQLEKNSYSEDGERITQKEIEPFPTLRAYNNAMRLLGCCLLAVEKYEKENKVLAPSCAKEISDALLELFICSRDEFDEWDGSVDYDKVAHTMLANITFDMLASGRYHIYTGMLNPLNCSANLMYIYNKAMDYGVHIGLITKEEQKEQREYLLRRISEVG